MRTKRRKLAWLFAMLLLFGGTLNVKAAISFGDYSYISKQPTIDKPWIELHLSFYSEWGSDSFFTHSSGDGTHTGPALYIDGEYVCSPDGELAWPGSDGYGNNDGIDDERQDNNGWWRNTYNATTSSGKKYQIKFWDPAWDSSHGVYYCTVVIYSWIFEMDKQHTINIRGYWKTNGSGTSWVSRSWSTEAVSSPFSTPTAVMENHNSFYLSGNLYSAYGPTIVGTTANANGSSYIAQDNLTYNALYSKGTASYSNQSISISRTDFYNRVTKPVEYILKRSVSDRGDFYYYKWYNVSVPGFVRAKNLSYVADKWTRKITLQWDADDSDSRCKEGSWRIYRKLKNGNSWTQLTSSDLAYTQRQFVDKDADLTYSVEYEYKIIFIPKNSPSGVEHDELTQNVTAIIVPSFNFSELFPTQKENSVQLSWTHESPGDGTQQSFKVWRVLNRKSLQTNGQADRAKVIESLTENDLIATVASSGTTTTFEDTHLANNMTLYLYIVSVEAFGLTWYSDVIGPTTLSGHTEILSVIANRGTYSNVVKVQWDVKQVGTDATRFVVSRRLFGSNDDYLQVHMVTGTEASYYFSDTEAQPGQFYQYRVAAQGKFSDPDTGEIDYQEMSSGEVDGFCQSRGVISGRITYGTGTAVADANVLLTKNNEDGDNVNQFYSMRVIPQGGIEWAPTSTAGKALFEQKPFTFQMYVRPEEVKENGSTILEGGNNDFALILKPAAETDKSELFLQVNGGEPQATGLVILNSFFTNVSVTCDGSTGWTVRVVNGNQVQTSSVTAASALTWSGDAVVFGSDKAFTVDHGFTGYLDDVRLWSKALTDDELLSNYDRLLVGTEAGLKLYWPMDEGVEGLTFAYDYSKTSGVANENHGQRQPNTTFSTEVPTEEQLRLYGKTDTEGNYVIRGVPFTGEGTSYQVRPTFGVHEFSPKHQTRFVNIDALTHNGVDFEDVSSFTVSGTVYYEHTSIPVEDASLYVDGTMASKDGEPIMTNSKGQFTIDVPIGDHFIQVKKNGHTFVKNGRYPDDPHGLGARATFESALSGLTFYDNTLVTVAGRVAGGDIEYEKPLGLGQGQNNIGKAVLRLEQENEKGYLNVPDQDPTSTTSTFDPSTEERQFTTSYGSAYVPADPQKLGNKNFITVETDETTGEWVAQLPPLRYVVTMVQIPSRPNNDMINTKSFTLPVIDATNPAMVYTDSVEVDGTLRSFDYQASAKMRYKSTSTIELSENEDGSFGMKTYKVKDLNKQEHTVDLYTPGPNGTINYTYGYPVYQQLSSYEYHLYAYERYTNYDGGTAVTVDVPLAGKTVTIKNQYASTTSVAMSDGSVGEMVNDKLELDDEGKATYMFTAGFPNTDGDFTRGLSISYDNNGTEVSWSQNETFKVIILGGMPSGNDFVTAGPDKVLMILRDPPGTNSSTTWSKGSSTSTTTINTTEFHSNTELNSTWHLGAKATYGSGVGFFVIQDMESKVNLEVGAEYEATRTTGDVTVSKTTTTCDISTNGTKDFVGANGDVFIGTARNVIFGRNTKVDILWDEEHNQPILDAVEALSKGEEFTTSFTYDQFYIKNRLIPNFLTLRNEKLQTVADISTIDRPAEGEEILYVTTLPDTDPKYGSCNDDEEIWGNEAVEFDTFDKTTGVYSGPSYTMILPVNYLETHEGVQDEVNYYNMQIKHWENELMLNEQAKVTAIQEKDKWFNKNYSFSAGSSRTVSVTSEDSTTDYDEQTDQVNAVLGGTTGFKLNGVGIEVKLSEKIGRTFNSGTDTETGSTTTTSFTLAEDGDDDYMTVDVYNAPDGFGPIFVTLGGATSCPYEDEVKTEYYLPGTVIMNKTMQIEKPEIVAQTQLITGVPAGSTGNFKVTITNKSETDEDVWFDIWVDPDSNPHGLSVMMDDASLNYGTTVMTKAHKPMEKTITVSQTDPEVLTYENVKIIIASQCQKDNNSTYSAITSETEFTVNFQPSCSDVKLASSHTIVNGNTEEAQTLSISGYNYSLKTLKGIRLQYKGVNDADFHTLQEYVKTDDPTSLEPTELPLPALTGTEKLNYVIDLRSDVFADKTYVFRAVTVCDQNSVEVINEGNEVNIIRDLTPPQLMATPSPASGILGSGDDLVITFNEDIQGSILTQPNNFEVVGVLNEGEVAHDVALSLTGTNTARTDATMDLSGKPFTANMWVNYQTDGTLLMHGTQNHNFTVAIEDGKLAVTVAGQKVTSTATLPQNKWLYLNIALDTYEGAESEGSILNAGYAQDASTVSLISNAELPAYGGNGPLSVGGNNLTAKVQELTLWNTNRSMAEAQADMYVTKSQYTSGLMGYWQLDEGRGTVAVDKARSRNMTLPGENAWWISGTNYALTLDGTKAAAVNIGSLNTLNSEDYLLETWFKADEEQDGVASILSTQKMDLRLNADGKMELETLGSTYAIDNSNLRDGQWHHVAVNVLKSMNGSGIVYLDGQQRKQISASAMPVLYGDKLMLGSHKIEGSWTYDQMLKGAIDEVRIWKSRRTANLISDNRYIRMKADTTGLVGYYPMEVYGSQNGLVVSNPTLDDVVTKGKNNAVVLSVYNAAGETVSSPESMLSSENTAALKPAPKRENVEFSFVASERQIRVVLNEIDAPRMEGCNIYLTVKRVKDMNGNTSEPISWSVYVQKSKLRWLDTDVAVTKNGTKATTFTATIENRSSEIENWSLSGMPEWLSANAVSGTLSPLSSATLTFTVDEGLPIGNYETTVYLTGMQAINVPLNISVASEGDAPNWTPVMGENTMTIVGVLNVDGVQSNDPKDMVAAFRGTECVGVASPRYFSRYDAYMVLLNIYGKTDGNLIYKAYDASTGTVYPSVSVNDANANTFAPDKSIGTFQQPVTFTTLDEIEQDLSHDTESWKWFSLYVQPKSSDMSVVFKDAHDAITTVTNGVSSLMAWSGTLGVDPATMYKLNAKSAYVETVIGEPVNPESVDITLKKNGWTWIGYPCQASNSLKTAFGDVDPQDGDQVKNQTSFALYSEGEWIGTLGAMQPGDGYMYNNTSSVDKTFHFPKPAVSGRKNAPRKGYEAYVPYKDNMTMVAVVKDGDELVEDAQVSVYCGTELRGLSTGAVRDGRHFLTIGGNAGVADVLTFVITTAAGDFAASSTETFQADALRGSMSQPVVLQLGEPTGIATMGMGIKSIQLYDGTGRLLRTATSPARLYSRDDLRQLPGGVYYQQVTYDNGMTRVQKMTR